MVLLWADLPDMTAPWNLIANAIFPRRCASCETPLAQWELRWCGPCEFMWTRHPTQTTQRFGMRLDWTFGFSWLRMVRPEERRLVHNLKYSGAAHLGVEIGKAMAKELYGSSVAKFGIDWALVPIPLHRKRRRQRGYNQSEQLSTGWSYVTGAPLLSALGRPHAGKSLTKFGRAARMRVGQNPFVWNPNHPGLDPAPQGILFIDDVITTGSTLEKAHAAARHHWKGPLAYITMADAAQ